MIFERWRNFSFPILAVRVILLKINFDFYSDLDDRGRESVNAMLTYILITLCLALCGVTGFQLTYMFYLDKLDKERKKRIHELEGKCRTLSARLSEAEERIDQQNRMIDALYNEMEDSEHWADVIDDR